MKKEERREVRSNGEWGVKEDNRARALVYEDMGSVSQNIQHAPTRQKA